MNPSKLFTLVAVAIGASTANAQLVYPFKLMKLPYPYDALEPVIGEDTLREHHLELHASYVKTLNELIEKDSDQNLKRMGLERMIKTQQHKTELWTSAVQLWNTNHYWKSLTPRFYHLHGFDLEQAMKNNFGSVEKALNEIKSAGLGVFGSGWVWLCWDIKEKKLVVTTTSGIGNPMTEGLEPIFVIDVSEHAYYLDYQEKRKDYLDAVLEKLICWGTADLVFLASPGVYEIYMKPKIDAHKKRMAEMEAKKESDAKEEL